MKKLILKFKIFWLGLVTRYYFYLKVRASEEYVLAITNNSTDLALALSKVLCISNNICAAKSWEELHPVIIKKQTIPELKQNEKEIAVKAKLAADLKREKNNG